MSRPRILSLCTGFGALDHAAQDVFDAELVAVSDIDPGANKILAHRYPNAPNLGDLKLIDWDAWAGVEIMTAGYPCQPFSHAGKRAGTDDPRHIFPWIVEGIRRVGPRLVLLENVRGHLRLGFDVVLGALADVGYDARWVCIRASDVGACHKRERLFIAATPADAGSLGWHGGPHISRAGWHTSERGEAGDHVGDGHQALGLLTPFPSDAKESSDSPWTPCWRSECRTTCAYPEVCSKRPAEVEHLLPTPAVNDMGRGKTVEAWDEWTARMKAAHGNGNGHGPSLEIEAMRLLPTPTSTDAKASGGGYNGQTNVTLTDATTRAAKLGIDFGKYTTAIARQEAAFGHPAPPPTEPTGKDGAHRLSPRFVEWLMNCEPGWVTEVPGLSRNEMLKALGNGVVKSQAAAALRFLTTPIEVAA